MDNNIVNGSGISTYNEGSLHSALKKWYSIPGDKFEVPVDGYIIDIVRDDLLIEIQTANFSAIKKKLQVLLRDHKIRLVYPIPENKWIVLVDKNHSKILRRRKSPKTGDILDIFDELIRIPALINQKNLSIEILFTEEEEIRCDDGKGSWRRQGVSILDKRLLTVLKKAEFHEKEDFLCLLPENLIQPFSTRDLAKELNITVSKARRVAYCLKKMQVIKEVEKIGNALLYEVYK